MRPTDLLQCEFDLIGELDIGATQDLEDSQTPDLSKFKNKSSSFPPASINENAYLFLKKVTSEILGISNTGADQIILPNLSLGLCDS